jgi:hypothetical protein
MLAPFPPCTGFFAAFQTSAILKRHTLQMFAGTKKSPQIRRNSAQFGIHR